MQVSWIDENNLRDLAGQLTNPSPGPTDGDNAPESKGLAWELHTLPDSAFEPAPSEAWQDLSVEVHEPEIATAPVNRLPEPPPEPQQAPLPNAAIDQIRESLRSVREKAAEAGLLKSVDVAPEITEISPTAPAALGPVATVATPEASSFTTESPPSEFSVPLGPVPVRLEAFAEWARSLLGSQSELFLLDEEGHLLWGVQAKSGMVLSAMLAWSAARHSSAAGATTMPEVLHKPLPDGGEICVVPCETHHGMIQIGVHCADPLSESRARLLRDALSAAMSVGEAC